MTHKRAYSDEASKVTTTTTTSTPRPCPAVENVQGQSMVLSKSSLCINGSHVYSSEPATPAKASPSAGGGALPARRALLEKCSPLSRSLQNLTRRPADTSTDPQKAAVLGSDGRRWSFDKSKKEDQADHTDPGSTSTDESTASQVASDPGERGKKPRRTLFSSGRSDSLPSKADSSQAGGEGRLRGWFGTGDSQNKPR